MDTTIKDRTIEFVKYLGITMKTFEQKCGLSSGYVTSMRKGFGSDKLNNVLMAYPELSREWLLYGEGDMLKDSVVQTSRGNNSPNINGNGNHVQGTSALLDNALELQRAALTEISEMRKLLQEQVRNNQEQARSNQEQFNRLTNIIESLTRKD